MFFCAGVWLNSLTPALIFGMMIVLIELGLGSTKALFSSLTKENETLRKELDELKADVNALKLQRFNR